MSALGDKFWHKRLSYFQAFDKITLEIVPRYKTSGLSGDEWRQHVEVTFFFKGNEVHNFGARDMDAAALILGGHLLNIQSPLPDKVLDLEKIKCDQPSCSNPPVRRYVLKEEFSRNGEKLDASDIYSKKYRQFCDKHKTRGDCGREDSDNNYDVEAL